MASGDTLVVFTSQANQPPSSNAATEETRGGVLLLAFDDTNDEEAIFAGVLPRHYDGGGVTVTIGWAAKDTTVAPHNAVWQAAFHAIKDDADDLDGITFAAFNGSGAVAEASASGELAYDTVTFTDGADMDSVAAGDAFLLKIRRDADDTSATDSLTDDAQLAFVEIKET